MNKILIMGKFTIEKEYWKVIKTILQLDRGDKTKFQLVNKPENYVLTKEEAKEYVLVITTQSNPLVLKNVIKVLGDVPLVKPYKNHQKELTHFMRLENVTVDYAYELYKLDNPVKMEEDQKPVKKPRKKPYNKEKQVERSDERNQEEREKKLDELLKNIETPVMEKPRKRRR